VEELTFAQLDKLEADRQAKKREVTERLAKILAKEFTLNELKFVQVGFGASILIEAFEIARSKAK
jgi:hypothetical protein